MARNELRPVVKLRSTARTGYTCVTRKNRRNDPDDSSCASTTRYGADYASCLARSRTMGIMTISVRTRGETGPVNVTV